MPTYSHYRRNLLFALGVLLLLCMGFWWWQNNHGTVGGKISWEKSMWLFTALSYFYLIPGWLWCDRSLDDATRSGYGWFFGGFVVRALVEVPLLLYTHIWRCWHGIAHDALMLVVLARALQMKSKAGRSLAGILVIALCCEAWNAWMFGQLGSPQTGIYFADDSEHFKFVNRVTGIEVIVCLSLLAGWLRAYTKGGAQ